jgi:hypothetical protein
MAIYYVRGVTAATAATADHVVAGLWNASSTARIVVLEFSIFKTTAGTAGDSGRLVRTSTRGTAGSSITPDADNANDGVSTVSSGAILDLAAYSVQPTLASPGMYGWVAAAVIASGVIIPIPRGIIVLPSTSLVFAQRVATAWPVSEVTFVFED